MSTPMSDGSPAQESENPLLRASNPMVSDLEQEVLDEYSRLLGNVNKVCSALASEFLDFIYLYR